MQKSVHRRVGDIDSYYFLWIQFLQQRIQISLWLCSFQLILWLMVYSWESELDFPFCGKFHKFEVFFQNGTKTKILTFQIKQNSGEEVKGRTLSGWSKHFDFDNGFCSDLTHFNFFNEKKKFQKRKSKHFIPKMSTVSILGALSGNLSKLSHFPDKFLL